MISTHLMCSDAGLLLDEALYLTSDCTRPCQMDSGRRPTGRRYAAGPSFLLSRRGTLGGRCPHHARLISTQKGAGISTGFKPCQRLLARTRFLDSEYRGPDPRKGLCLYFKC